MRRDVRRAHGAWVHLEKRARREGIDVTASMTPEELVAALSEAGFTQLGAAEELMHLYQSVRFGGRTLGAEGIRTLDRVARAVDQGRCEKMRRAA